MSGWTTGSQSSLREANRAAILEAVKRFGGLTQVELAASTGLSAATVSTIVKQLLADGLVDVAQTTRSGRRAQLVTVARRVGLAAGVHVGVRSLRLLLGDFAGEVVLDQRMPLPHEHRLDTTMDRVALLVVEMLERVGAEVSELTGIGVGVPAPIDTATGQVSVRGIMRGWDDEHIGQVLTKRLGVPAYVDNDANLGALAEARYGAGREVLDMLYVRFSYGIGAGVVVGHRLFRGYAGTAGEIGHVQVDPQGAICRCGSRGCLETVVGAESLTGPLAASLGPLTLRDVITRAKEGDPGCARVVADAGDAIGAVLAGASQTLNPQLIVVGGEVAETGELLLDPMRRALRRGMLPNLIAPVELVPAQLGSRAEAMGALAWVLDNTDVLENAQEVGS